MLCQQHRSLLMCMLCQQQLCAHPVAPPSPSPGAARRSSGHFCCCWMLHRLPVSTARRVYLAMIDHDKAAKQHEEVGRLKSEKTGKGERAESHACSHRGEGSGRHGGHHTERELAARHMPLVCVVHDRSAQMPRIPPADGKVATRSNY